MSAVSGTGICRALCVALATGMSIFCGNAANTSKPNLIVVLTDDQGYQDVGCFGSPLIKTPNLDRMAREGVRFSSFYAASTICSPSRAGLLTGRNPERIGIHGVYFPHHDKGMPLIEMTLAELLKSQGYATACVGKWHLGHLPQYLPQSRGFDHFFGIPYSNDMWLDSENIPPSENILFRDGKTLDDYLACGRSAERSRNQVPLMRGEKCVEWPADQATLTRRYVKESISFIKENEDRPFFLYLAPAMPHVPLFASEDFAGKSARGLYGDCIEEIDWGVGELLRTLKEDGLDRNTLVVFTSDNGPWTIQGENAGSALPLRSGKNSSYEGGSRVPCIMWWPGTIPAGHACDEIVSALDILPTVAAAAHAALPADRTIDGHNILPLLRGDAGAESPWDTIYFEQTALRCGKWKFRKGPEKCRYYKKDNPVVTQLFNLEDDLGESVNLAERYPEKIQHFQELLIKFKQEVRDDGIVKK